MKTLFTLAIFIIAASSSVTAQKKGGVADTMKHATFYTCPMHADVHSNKRGKCPKCGMALNLSAKEQMKAAVTKNYVCPVHGDVTSHDPANCPKCGRKMNLSPKEQMKAETIKLYTCLMHPEVALNKDGVCPKCGKVLVEKKDKKANR